MEATSKSSKGIRRDRSGKAVGTGVGVQRQEVDERRYFSRKEERMLVLTRKASEKIRIGSEIEIEVIRCGPTRVRIGIKAPAETKIVRGELPDKRAA